MHADSQVRAQAQRCLDNGGPTIVVARSDRWSGGAMTAPVVHNLASLVSAHDDREGKALEEQLVRDAFAAFRAAYLDGLREIVGEDQSRSDAEAKPEPAPLAWPQATEVPDTTPVSKPLEVAEVI